MASQFPSVSLRLPPDESRVKTSDHGSIDIPSQALAHEVRRRTVDSVRKRSFRQRLEGDRGHVEKKLPQMRATPCATKVCLDGMTPARSHGASNHLLHRSLSDRALWVRHVIHRNRNLAHHKSVVDRYPYRKVVNWLSGKPGPLPRDVHRMRLRVAHLGLNVPQPVFSLKTTVYDISRMGMSSGLRCWQWQIRTSCE